MHVVGSEPLTLARAYALSVRQLCDARVELMDARRTLVAIALCGDPEKGREMAADFVAGIPAADIAGMLPADAIDQLERLNE